MKKLYPCLLISLLTLCNITYAAQIDYEATCLTSEQLLKRHVSKYDMSDYDSDNEKNYDSDGNEILSGYDHPKYKKLDEFREALVQHKENGTSNEETIKALEEFRDNLQKTIDEDPTISRSLYQLVEECEKLLKKYKK